MRKTGPAVLMSVLALGVGTAAGQNQPPDRPPLVFRSDVTLVAVPVFVTDKRGVAVSGLMAEDFEITENGKTVPVAAFQAVDVDQAEPPATSGLRAASEAAPLAFQAATPRQFVILIDSLFSSTRGLRQGRPAAAAFVRRSLAPTDLVSVVDSGEPGFSTLVSFTTDHEYAAQAIEREKRRSAAGPDPLGVSGRGISGASFSVLGSSASGQAFPKTSGSEGNRADAELAFLDSLEARAAADAEANRTGAFLTDLSRLIKELAVLRGRKQIVLLSGGFPEGSWMALPGSDVSEATVNADRMRRIFRDAGAADVVINTISLDGIRAAGDVGESQGPDINRPPQAARALNQGAGRAALVSLALDTGGRFIYPTNDYGIALNEVDRISRRFYMLGFETSGGADDGGGPRRLTVRVKRSGLTVSHRKEYSLKGAPSRATPEREASEAIAKGLSGGAVRLGLATTLLRRGPGDPSLHAVLQIQAAEFARTSEATTPVEIYGYLMSEGRVVDSVSISAEVDSTKHGEALRESGLHIVLGFPKTPPRSDLRFFVRVGKGGESGSLSRAVPASRSRPDDAALSPPILTSAASGKVVIPFQAKDREALPIPFRVAGVRFLPDMSAALRAGIPHEVCVLVSRGGSTPSPYEVRGALVHPTAGPLPVRVSDLRVFADTDGFDRYLLNVTMDPGTEGGDYLLRLTFKDPSNGREVTTEGPVSATR